MFGVGLHFSLTISWRSGRSRYREPGQILVATPLGMGLAWGMGWGIGAGLVFGLALSVASTVVLLARLQERRLVETERGRIAVGWLIVEDLAMVLTLVLLPAVAGLLGGDAADAGAIAASSIARRHLAHARQGRRIRRDHAGGRAPAIPWCPALCRPFRIARTVPAGGARHRARRRVRRGQAVRCVASRSAPSSPA